VLGNNRLARSWETENYSKEKICVFDVTRKDRKRKAASVFIINLLT